MRAPPQQERASKEREDVALRLRSTLTLLLGALPLTALLIGWYLHFQSEAEAPHSEFFGAWRQGGLISMVTWREGLSVQWWRLLSAPLAHADLKHLSANLSQLLLMLIGGGLLPGLRWRGVMTGLALTLYTYLLSVACFALRATTLGGWSLGLSGGLLGLNAFMIATLWRAKHTLWAVWAVIGVPQLLLASSTGDHLSHSFGFGVGLLTGALFGPALHAHLTPHDNLNARLRAYLRAHVRAPHSKLKPIALSAALLMSLAVAWGVRVTWERLNSPSRLWSSWVTLSDVSELGAPGLSNGLCTAGHLSQTRALSPPWSDYPQGTGVSHPLSPTLTLWTRAVKGASPHATHGEVLNTSDQVGSEAVMHLICLTPLHIAPLSEAGREALRDLSERLSRSP
jgi:membrane associated rhomboid family serine protease